MRSRLLRSFVPPAITLAVFLLGWEAFVRVRRVPAYLLPPPSAVWEVLRHPATGGPLWRAVWVTGQAALAGFGLSAAGGVLLAVLLSASRWGQRAFYPYAVFFQTVPIIAMAPLLVVWLGYGIKPVIASAFIVAIFPVIANTLTGLLSVDPALRDLFRLYGAGPLATLVKLKLPAALPHVLTGLRIAAGLAVIGTIVGEFIATITTHAGLGTTIQVAMKESHTATVFAAILLASLLGLALFGAVNLAGHFALRRWHASESGG